MVEALEATVTIRAASAGDDLTAFRVLNEEWITRYFALEEKDREVLSNPAAKILSKGGYIFMARLGEDEVGCVALIPRSAGVYELSKMAVSPRVQGMGIGRKLLEHCIGEARAIGAVSLFLASNTKLENAVHLYEAMGFRHVPASELPDMGYSRSNVFMNLSFRAPGNGNASIVRRATSQDIAGLMELVRRVVPLMRATGNLQWGDDYPNAAVFEKDVEAAQLWIAEDKGRVAGVVALTTEQSPEYADVGWDLNEAAIVVHRLAVDPASRGKGIAAALMHQAEIVAKGLGISVLRVDTNTQNEATQRLFPKLGYAFSGEIDLQIRPGLRFFCYEKRLRPEA